MANVDEKKKDEKEKPQGTPPPPRAEQRHNAPDEEEDERQPATELRAANELSEEEESEVSKQVEKELKSAKVAAAVATRVAMGKIELGLAQSQIATVDTDNPYGLKEGEKAVYIEDGFIKDPDGEIVGTAPESASKTRKAQTLKMGLEGLSGKRGKQM